ncbi:MAG: membrane bound O-acyl transferase MBOAT family protein [Candidatus Peregrinibacteria bacterium Greene1014_49]|nr:MAG: membrane bound O-acyl transferase MBOAT family protein [Candidatus Peregrinibacteria bacterium Greene1014_49]
MLFHSPIFLFWFLPLLLTGYAIFIRQRILFLLLGSYVFYMWWNPFFLPLLLGSTILNFWIGKKVAAQREVAAGKWWMGFGVFLNLLILGFFKYQGMIGDTLTWAIGQNIPTFSIGLPLAISFFTFEGISYLVDVYRGAAPARTFTEFACFISFFPHLIAGPIIRFPAIAPQFSDLHHPWIERAEGLYRFILGLSKKVLLADTLALIADPIFALSPTSAAEAWLGLTAYTFQIYFDFSSYTDMAIGLGLIFGFRLPENFDTPYFSKSITEFWRRWHMTLSAWIRDYLYFPLGGSRRSLPRVAANLIIVMTLAGLWHGAAWTFVLWGLYYGVLLALEKIVLLDLLKKLPTILQHSWTVLLVMMGWILFRTPNLSEAAQYSRALFSSGTGAMPEWWAIAPVCIALLFVFCEPRLLRCPPRFSLRLSLGFAVLTMISLLITFGSESSPFIYFQF